MAYYVLDDHNNRIAAFDQEGFLAVLQQAIADQSLENIDPDSAVASKLRSIINGTTHHIEFVTQAEYNTLAQGGELIEGCYYFITDDTTEEDIEEALDNLADAVDAAQDDIDALESAMTAAQDDIDALESAMTAAQDDIDALESAMTTAQGDIANLKIKSATPSWSQLGAYFNYTNKYPVAVFVRIYIDTDQYKRYQASARLKDEFGAITLEALNYIDSNGTVQTVTAGGSGVDFVIYYREV